MPGITDKKKEESNGVCLVIEEGDEHIEKDDEDGIVGYVLKNNNNNKDEYDIDVIKDMESEDESDEDNIVNIEEDKEDNEEESEEIKKKKGNNNNNNNNNIEEENIKEDFDINKFQNLLEKSYKSYEESLTSDDFISILETQIIFFDSILKQNVISSNEIDEENLSLLSNTLKQSSDYILRLINEGEEEIENEQLIKLQKKLNTILDQIENKNNNNNNGNDDQDDIIEIEEEDNEENNSPLSQNNPGFNLNHFHNQGFHLDDLSSKEDHTDLATPKGEGYECQICFETVSPYEVFRLSCGHRYCRLCLKEYFKTRIENGLVLHIPCPNLNCGEGIIESDIDTIVDRDAFLRYQQFHNLATLRAEPTVRWCPKPDCESAIFGDPNHIDFPTLTCTTCDTKFCYHCNYEDHPGLSCKKNKKKLKKEGKLKKETKNEKWKKKHKSKQCLQCRMDIVKDKGCNHMHCPSCGYQFCWICEKPFTPDHYIFGGCKGLQFSQHPIAKKRLKKLGRILLGGLVLGGFIFIGVPIIIAGVCIVIIVAVPIIIVTAPIVGIVKLVKHIKKKKKEKKLAREAAKINS